MTLADVRMNSEEVKAEYTSSLADLTFNSKPLINVLTMLAEENIAHATDIVAAIEEHLAKVQTNVKLPVLYLIDCIAKNIGKVYTTLFSQNIVMTFCSVFKVVDEETRAEMFKLRQTWNNIFPQKKLYAIDVQINMLDPAWPVTAQPPSNSIHFNPKFLKTTIPKTDNSSEAATNLDVETFAMQQKLIQKQKELIDLQQKKLKLELLQTQVKLQKQLENNPNAALPPRTQNILLKPEVAKQLMPEMTKQMDKEKPSSNMIASRVQSSGPRIAPANSALIAAASKPTRDPRLLRQQNEAKAGNGTVPINANVPLGSKPPVLDSNNKIVSNIKNVRDNRIDPRLVNNKDNVPLSQNKLDKSRPFPKSRQSEQKLPKLPRSNKISSESEVKSFSGKNIMDSPTKSKSDKIDVKSPTKLPSRHKKAVEKKSKDSKRDREAKSHKNDSPPATFKGVRAKNRNYIRRNRSPSFSPEPSQDIDLRLTAPPEKLPRLQNEIADDKGKSGAQGMDVDLRNLNDVSKKRSSTDNTDSLIMKKSKTEVFDELFGNEDTDLRTVLPVAQPERPPTPPPPIISTTEKDKEVVKSSDFDAVRAKLANATGRDKIMAKSFHKKRLQEDEDLRVSSAKDSLKKIIISTDDEQCIKAGTMTKEQEKVLMNKIIAQIEHQKLKEAQAKDKQDNLQPVSDEELEFVEETEGKVGDRDERVSFPKFSRDGRGENRRGGGAYWRGNKRRHWDNAHPRSGVRPWMHQPNAWRPIGPNNFGRPAPSVIEVEGKKSPEPSDMVVDSVQQDDIKNINIDAVPRDIRYYDETAVVFMNWDEPREISFQNGSRRVSFDDKDVYLLSFNEDYKELSINGVMHRVRLGAPSREIFIDGKPYECYFGGPGITIDLGEQMTVVKLDGPPPQVKIGNVIRRDLVAGRVNLIIDAKILVPVFLDAKLQKFVIDGETHTLKFVDALKTVLINDVPFNVEFGGLPKPITVHDKKHFIRFSVLPKGVRAGSVVIKDMEGTQIAETDGNSQDSSAFANVDSNEPALPVIPRKKVFEDEPDRNSNSPHFFQNIVNQSNLDMLSSVMTSSFTPISNNGGYQVESLAASAEPQTQPIDSSLPYVNPVPQLPATLNINELFQKLVATGMVATKEPVLPLPQDPNGKAPQPIKRNYLENLRNITFSRPETLKVRQSRLYESLYSGMQCSSCGMRFPPEQSMHYSQHLDWHFRQNRKGKKNIRVAASRRWYYSLSDWKNYEEIEDLEEREKNYFDQQQLQAEGANDDLEEEVEIPSVPADSYVADPHCEVCQDRFDQFFNEDKEEWHLKNAIRVDDKTYHPVCYEDYLASLADPVDESKEEEKQEEIKEKEELNIPGLEIILDDDDEEEEPPATIKEDQVIIDESDESKLSPEEAKPEESNTNEDEDDDDDVIINEVVPEKIEVDDDKEYLEDLPGDSVPIKVEQIDDGFMDVEEGLMNIKGGNQIKIKSEPVDPDEELAVVGASEPTPAFVETSQPAFTSSIDGNTEPASSVPTAAPNVGSKIRINISKPLPVIAPKEPKEVPCDSVPLSLEPVIDPSQPLPPGEEPIQLNIKPALRGVELKKLPPVQKGSELTGMCSIM